MGETKETKETKEKRFNFEQWLLNHKALLLSVVGILFALFMVIIEYKFTISYIVGVEPVWMYLKKLYWLLAALIFTQIGVMWYFHFVRQKKLAIEKVAMITITFWGLIFMLILPPVSAPDEDTTYASCYALSNTLLGKKATNEDGFVYMRACDVKGVLHRRPGRDDYQTVKEQLFDRVSASDKEMVLCSIQKQDAIFWNFLPQAIGISIARIFGFGQVMVLYAARMVNFLVYLGLFYAAIRRMPFGKHILFVIACFPMMLEQVSSMSYDALVLGLSFYFVALVLDLVYRREQVSIKDTVLMITSMVFLAPTKVIYGMFSLLCFLIPKKKFGTTKRYLITIAIMVVAVSASILAAQSNRFMAYIHETNATISYSNNMEDKLLSYDEAVEIGAIADEDEHLYTFSIVLHNIPRMIAIFGNTLWLQGSVYFDQMFGKYLGWLELELPSIIVYGFFAVFLMTFLKRKEDPIPSARQKLMFTVVSVIIGCLAYLFMLVGHTRDGSTFCMGVQGRYFLPFLPLIPLIFWSDRIEVGRKPLVTMDNEKESNAKGEDGKQHFLRDDYRYWYFMPTIVLIINLLLTMTFAWVFCVICSRLGCNM